MLLIKFLLKITLPPSYQKLAWIIIKLLTCTLKTKAPQWMPEMWITLFTTILIWSHYWQMVCAFNLSWICKPNELAHKRIKRAKKLQFDAQVAKAKQANITNEIQKAPVQIPIVENDKFEDKMVFVKFESASHYAWILRHDLGMRKRRKWVIILFISYHILSTL